MYAAVRRYEGVTDPVETGRLVSEGFVPLMRQVPGFVAYYWIDAGDGVMISTIRAIMTPCFFQGDDRKPLRHSAPNFPA